MLGGGDNVGTTFGEHHPLKMCEGKNGHDLRQLLTLTANISGREWDVKNQNSSWSTTALPALGQKNC